MYLRSTGLKIQAHENNLFQWDSNFDFAPTNHVTWSENYDNDWPTLATIHPYLQQDSYRWREHWTTVVYSLGVFDRYVARNDLINQA